MDASYKKLEHISSDTNEDASNLFDELHNTNILYDNIETTCNTNEKCESCIILPNSIVRDLSSRNKYISGYTFNDRKPSFTICYPNLETNINPEELSGGSLYSSRKRSSRRNTRGGGNCISSGTCGEEYNSVMTIDSSGRRTNVVDNPSNESMPSIGRTTTWVDKPEMISLDGIMIIIVDLHGGLDLPVQPINPDSIAITNFASIAAAPPGLTNIALPEFTRQMHELFIRTDLKKGIEDIVQQNFQDNLQKIEDIAAAASGGNPKSKVEKKMSLVSPDLCVLLLDNLRKSVKESNATSFSDWRKLPQSIYHTPLKQAALDNPDDRYRRLNIIKGFGVDPDVTNLPYKKYVSYHDKNDRPTKMGVTTMTFRVNKNNKVTCGKKFTSADVFMPLIKYDERPDPDGGTSYTATMEELITYFIKNAKKPPETIVMMDLTCSNCSDGRVLSKPLAEYRDRRLPGGSNKKMKATTTKPKNKTKNKTKKKRNLNLGRSQK